MIDQVFAQFAANVEALVSQVEEYEVFVAVGAAMTSEGTPPPKVIFAIDPHEKIAGQKQSGGGGAYGSPTPKVLMTREVGFDVHIWGKDRDQTEALINHVTNAVHIAASGSYRMRTGTWQGEDGSVNNFGTYYILRGEVDVPITRPPQSVVIGVPMPITVPDPMAVLS